MGKAYANVKKLEDKPLNDFYPTPTSLVYELLKTGELDNCKSILEPACGTGNISNILIENGFEVCARDIINGNDFLKDIYNESYDAIITNPPFKLWDDFVMKAKSISPLVIMIGQTNYFGVHSRNVNGVWDNLSDVYIFDRKVAYDRPSQDGRFETGALTTGWFIWKKNYNDLPKIHIIDVDKYVRRKSDEKTNNTNTDNIISNSLWY